MNTHTVWTTKYESCSINVLPCGTVQEKEATDGMVERYAYQDFIVSVDDWTALFGATEPATGDVVVFDQRGMRRTYRVTPPDGVDSYRLAEPYDNNEFRYTNSYHTAMRIHAKLINEVVIP